MTLKSVVNQKIMNEVIKQDITKKDRNKGIDWRILVVDHFAMRIISACCKIHEISDEGIAIVEDLQKNREPLILFEAIYFISPCVNSIRTLIDDFSKIGSPKYKAAHIYFTETCPDELFNNLRQSPANKFIKTLKEINLAFIAYEQQVFSLDYRESFQCFYNPLLVNSRVSNLERTAEQIASVCATLGEYPSIRYRIDFKYNFELANIVKKKLDAFKADDPTMGKGPEKAKSQLIILDRGFDCISPVLHELTLQAMAYDLLPIENDIYKYNACTKAGVKEVLLDENDDIWVKLRHEHIGVVSKEITKNLKQFIDSKRMSDVGENKSSLRDLSIMMKKMPQYQKELSKYSTHLNLAEDCMKCYQDNVKFLYDVEQDLAMGTDVQDEKIRDHMLKIIPILLEPKISRKDKLRIIILYVLSKNGTTEEIIDKLIKHAQLSPEDKKCIVNLNLLGINTIISDNIRHQYQIPRKQHEYAYSISRWTPVINDIMEYCIENKLDTKYFPFLSGRDTSESIIESNYARSARFHGNWGKERVQQQNVSRIIVFVVGGISYSEIRCAYEVSKKFKNWEIIIGSSHIFTPEDFLNDLSALCTE